MDQQPISPTNNDHSQILQQDHDHFVSAAGTKSAYTSIDEFSKDWAKAQSVVGSTGLTKTPTQGHVQVGFDSQGNTLYSPAQIANSTDIKTGSNIINTNGAALGAMGAFKDHTEATAFFDVGQKASNPAFLGSLDKLKSAGDTAGFMSAIGKSSGGVKPGTDYTGFSLFNNWGNLSDTQKSVAIAGIGTQGFKFSNGQGFDTKNITPDVKGVPPLKAGEGLSLANQNINVAPVARQWDQHATLQQTFYSPKTASDVVQTANSLGLLGYGMEGQSVPTTKEAMSKYSVVPAPHYGVGAATIPVGQGAPTGYSVVKTVGDKQIVSPTNNVKTLSVNTPDISTNTAVDMYKNWDKQESTLPVKGTVGGSAMIGGLHAMSDSNPYSLGAVMTHNTYQHAGVPSDTSDLSHIGNMAQVTINRLTQGGASAAIDGKNTLIPLTGSLDVEPFQASVKQIRGQFSQGGIPSKEVGYMLANQAFAEGRLNESQHVTAQKTLDMVFDDNGYTLASKLATGKDKGIEITKGRNG